MGHRVSRIGPPRDLLVAPITLAAVAPERPFSGFFASRNGWRSVPDEPLDGLTR